MTRPFSFLLFALFLSALPGFARAAALTQDLGQGLAYHRARTLPADLPSAESLRGRPCVLDLRYATGDAAAATALSAWLKFYAGPRVPVFVLANSGTSGDLLAAFAHRERTAGLIVLGVAAASFIPDIALAVPPELERNAYDALEHGATLDSLINVAIDKPRNDEARLARERQPDAASARDDSVPAASEKPAAADAAKPAAPPVDLVLQRAVQLHRTLLALKKL